MHRTLHQELVSVREHHHKKMLSLKWGGGGGEACPNFLVLSHQLFFPGKKVVQIARIGREGGKVIRAKDNILVSGRVPKDIMEIPPRALSDEPSRSPGSRGGTEQ